MESCTHVYGIHYNCGEGDEVESLQEELEIIEFVKSSDFSGYVKYKFCPHCGIILER